jgi:hypothetical protein
MYTHTHKHTHTHTHTHTPTHTHTRARARAQYRQLTTLEVPKRKFIKREGERAEGIPAMRYLKPLAQLHLHICENIVRERAHVLRVRFFCIGM